MPDITLAYNPSSGGATSASGFNGDIYTPATRTSFETINGWLDRDNRESAWKVSWDKVRPHSMADAESVGATINLDYFCVLFPTNPDITGAFIPIPGATKTVYARRAGGIIRVVVTVVMSNSLADSTSNGMRFRLRKRVPGSTAFSDITGFQQVVAGCSLSGTKRIYKDRQFTFSHLETGVSLGEYEFALSLWMTGALAATSIGADGIPTANLVSSRIRCRSMTTDWTG